MRGKVARTIVLWTVLVSVMSFPVAAQEKKGGGMPPAKVVVATMKSGTVAPESEFIGTIYYSEVSEIAAEVSGKVEKVSFEEGFRVKKNADLVRLSSDILEKTLESTKASYEQVLSDLEKARLDFQRIENLYKEESIAEQVYDENRFNVKSLEKRSDSLSADVARLELELDKKVIRSPFNGIVIKRNVDVGEWLSPGGVVATVARYDVVEVMVNVPQAIVNFIKPGLNVVVLVGTDTYEGKVFSVVPSGDVATRTFPVKIRLRNSGSLKGGMEAKVKLPTGRKEDVFIIPRDAVLTQFGNTVIYAVIDNKAAMLPVKVIGYEGLNAGIASERISKGMSIVVKGNERLREGQPLMIINNGDEK